MSCFAGSKKISILFTIFLAALCSLQITAEPVTQEKRIAVFTPTSEGNTYWPQVYRILNSAAEDLNITLESYEFDVGNRFAKQKEGVEILKRNPRLDGAIFSVAFGQALPLLEAAEELGIPSFIQGPLFKEEMLELGGLPRRKYRSWVGYFYQNEEEKGYKLGRILIETAVEQEAFAADGLVHVAGIGGDFTWYGTELRERGLKRAVEEEPRAKLMQIVPTQWTPEEAREKTSRLLVRYPEISVIWAASDQLALGAAEALEAAGRIPGETAFTGGLDLSTKGLEAVKEGRLVATVAGSLFSYAEVLVYLYDYLMGIDFSWDVGTMIGTDIHTASSENVDFLLDLFRDYETIDFSRFSKAHNPELVEYDFALEKFDGARE